MLGIDRVSRPPRYISMEVVLLDRVISGNPTAAPHHVGGRVKPVSMDPPKISPPIWWAVAEYGFPHTVPLSKIWLPTFVP
jgi:hypothetical protein